MTKEEEQIQKKTSLSQSAVEGRVSCPVCMGKKLSIYGGKGPCLCCKGEGTITERHAEVLPKIRADLKKRLTEKGWGN